MNGFGASCWDLRCLFTSSLRLYWISNQIRQVEIPSHFVDMLVADPQDEQLASLQVALEDTVLELR